MADEENLTSTITVDLNKEQIAFLTKWQKTHEQELGIDVPLGALVRKAVDATMKAENKKSEKPDFEKRGDRSNKSFGDRKPSFGDKKPGFDRRSSGPRPGARASLLPKSGRRF